MNIKLIILSLFILFGMADASYLTYEHYRKVIPPCTVYRFIPIASDCGKVLRSSYSVMFGVPLAVLGIVQYSLLLVALILLIIYKKKIFSYWLIAQSITGAVFSVYFIYIQLIILQSFCLYCMLSALISFIIFFIVDKTFEKERFGLRLLFLSYAFQYIVKPIFFLMDPEFIHGIMVSRGELFGKTFVKNYFDWKLNYRSSKLKQKIAGINFNTPVGLAAGFDYNANLTQILYSVGFGFQSVGTITNQPYEGNPKPRLGRLIKSKSLMVNKGFKNPGVTKIVEKLNSLKFQIPLGISVGASNNENIENVKVAINDIKQTFTEIEKNNIKNSYYELNISCPNLINTKIDLYKSENLNLLLKMIKRLKLKKPIFVKMPIEESNQKFIQIVNQLVESKIIKGIIVGNLWHKNFKNAALVPSEVKKFKVGNFSGKPCEERSNELIKLAYKKYGKKLIIIGCGGIFNGQDAYKKIKLGASLVQLITGMIFQGPQLISQINLELEELLEKDGYDNISQAIGSNNK